MLDIKTLLVVLTATALMTLAMCLAVYFKRFQVRGTGAWALAFLVLACGGVLMALRSIMHPVFGVLAAHCAILSGYALLCHGMRLFFTGRGLSRLETALAACLIGAALAGVYCTFVAGGTINTRIAIVHAALGLILLDNVRTILRHGRGRSGALIVGASFLLYALLCFVLAFYQLFWGDTRQLFQSWAVSWLLLYTLVFGIVLTVGLIFMVGEELQSRLAGEGSVLRENIRLRDDVESITRHDLKTPIAPVVQALGYLLTDFDLAPDVRGLVARSKRSALEALDLVNRSLDIYRLEHGRYRPVRESVDLARQLARAGADVTASPLRAKGVAVDMLFMGRPLEGGDSLVCQGEVSLVHSMMANLLKNAVEASPGGERVVAALEREGDTAVLRVENRGEVPAKVRHTLFDKFTTSGKPGGTGLGAYSARLAAEEHGGDIRLDDSVPGTVRVVVTLPLHG